MSWCKKCRTCAAVKRPKIKARGRMQPQNVGDIADPLPVIEEGNKYRKNVKGYHDGLQEKLPSGRMKTRYDLNSVRLQEEDLMWLYNPQRSKDCCPKLSSDWEDSYTFVTRINDVVYRIRQGQKTEDCSLRSPHELRQ